MVMGAPPDIAIPIIQAALKDNPYSADFVLALMQMNLAKGDEVAAAQAYLTAREFLPLGFLARAGLKMVRVQ